MSDERLPLQWVFLSSLPGLYLLVASSKQFQNYSPHEITPTHWYVALVLTGIFVCYLAGDLSELVIGGVVVMVVNVFGYVGSYFVALWLIGGYELASLGLNLLVQPTLLYTFVGSLFLIVGYALATILSSLAGY